MERSVLGFDVSHVPVDFREHEVEMADHPVVLVVRRDLELDRQRAIGPGLVLTDETIRLEPAWRKSALGEAAWQDEEPSQAVPETVPVIP